MSIAAPSVITIRTYINGAWRESSSPDMHHVINPATGEIAHYESGNFVKPTILDDVPATSMLADTEIFGPVLSLIHADSLDKGSRVFGAQRVRESSVIVHFQRVRRAAVPL